MKAILIPILIISTIWHMTSTAVGAIGILGDQPMELAASILLTLTVVAVLLNSSRIFERRKGAGGNLLMVIWIIAAACGAYTSWLGNARYLIMETQTTALILVTGLTILSVAAPVLLSFLFRPQVRTEKTAA